MAYEQWETLYKATIVLGLLACVPVALAFYHFTKRHPDDAGRRKGRPLSSTAIAIAVFFGPNLAAVSAFPGYWERHLK